MSRKDHLAGGDAITTFDIRMKLPNREASMFPSAMHTIEHLGATYLRNHADWADKVIYWGPMGCCTGFYLILKGDLESLDIVPLMRELFQWMWQFEGEIPGANPHDCGNYRFNHLGLAKWEARTFYWCLVDIKDENMVYPKNDR